LLLEFVAMAYGEEDEIVIWLDIDSDKEVKVVMNKYGLVIKWRFCLALKVN
jgi:hypothetical protein